MCALLHAANTNGLGIKQRFTPGRSGAPGPKDGKDATANLQAKKEVSSWFADIFL